MIKSLFTVGLVLMAIQSHCQNSEIVLPEPEVVGEATVSSTDFEFNFSPNRNSTLAFFSKALLPDWRRISIVYTRKEEGTWKAPELAPFSGRYRDADPFIFPDQSKLIFISDRPSKYQKKSTDYSLWIVDAPFIKNQQPYLLEGEFYEDLIPVYPSVTLNNSIFFSSVGDNKDSDIYRVKERGGKYGKAESLPFNSVEEFDYDPIVAPDGSFVVFVSRTRKGFGGSDLYISFHQEGKWTAPVNLGPQVNSFRNEGQPGISADGKTLYFGSDRPQEKADYRPRETKIIQEVFLKEFRTPFNGLPNIWKVDISQLAKN